MKNGLVKTAAIFALLGCASAPRPSDSDQSARTPAVPADLLYPYSLYDIRGEVDPLDESETLHEPLGTPRLRTTELPLGTREIRIYTGAVITYPRTGLIVRESNGGVSGRLFRYWPVNDTAYTDTTDMEALFAKNEEGRCGKPARGKDAGTCDVRFSREPDWRAFLKSLDSVNAWTLPDESKVPRRGMVLDGWVITVEARRDTSYNQYEYHNPQIYRPPEGRNALRIMGMVDSLFRYTFPPKDLQYVRGVYLYGRDSSDFIPCGRPHEAGFFEGNLKPIVKLVGDSAWKAHAAPTKVFRVEAWTRISDRPVSHYNRTFSRVFRADSVMIVQPSSSRTCSQQR